MGNYMGNTTPTCDYIDNKEWTMRSIHMQPRPDGTVHTKEMLSNDPRLSDDVKRQLLGLERATKVDLKEGQAVFHEDDFDQAVEQSREDGREDGYNEGFKDSRIQLAHELNEKTDQIDQLRATNSEVRSHLSGLKQQAQKAMTMITEVRETAEKEKEELRLHMVEEEKSKMTELQEQWKLALEDAKKDAVAAQEAHIIADVKIQEAQIIADVKVQEAQIVADMKAQMTEQQVADLEIKYKEMLEEQLENEKTVLRLQLEQENNDKLEEVETSWKATLLEADERAHNEQEELRVQMEERVQKSTEVAETQLQEVLEGKLQEYKESLRLQLAEENNQNLQEAEATWKATLVEAEEQAEKQKEELQLRIAEQVERDTESSETQLVDTLRQKLEDVENEKQQLLNQWEEEENVKLDGAKWQEIFREATGKAVHINGVDDARAVIGEIEESWMSKLDEEKRVHADLIRSIEDSRVNEKLVAETKIVEQETLVNDMLQKLQKVQSREAVAREQFNTSAEKVESQLTPLKERAVCVEPRDVVLGCYAGKKPLECSQVLNAYVACVDIERIALLKKNVAAVS